jgi:hypothetical protein
VGTSRTFQLQESLVPVRSLRSVTLGAALLAGVALTPALTPALGAQAAPPVRLTMASVTRLFNGMQQLGMVAIAHPELGDSLSIDGDSSEAQAAAQLARKPFVVAALRKAGLTPLEYVNTSMAYLGAQMAYGLSKSVKGYKVPAEEVANVAFVRAHEAELTALQQRMEAEMRKLVPKTAGDDDSGDDDSGN